MRNLKVTYVPLLTLGLLLVFAGHGTLAGISDGTVASEQKISDTAGGFGGVLDNGEQFGTSVANLGDLDGDGITDLAVGAHRDSDGDTEAGAVWILFLDTDGTVKSEQKISETVGGFGGILDAADSFGYGVANLGDLDGDGITDLAVAAIGDDDGQPPVHKGAVWILFLNTNGTVKAEQKISDTAGGFGGVLDETDNFGTSVSGLGDLDGDGNPDLAVGTRRDGDGGPVRGAVYILFLNTNGTVKSEQKISDTAGGFGGGLNNDDLFGESVANLGDLDGDGIIDLAVGAFGDNDGGTDRGAVWILFLDTDGTVKSEQKISDTAGGFGGSLNDSDFFGESVNGVGDLDGDGVTELAVGAYKDNDGGTDRGAVWILFLATDGTVRSEQKLSDLEGGFGGALLDSDQFGFGVANLGDLDGDGIIDLAVGAFGDNDGGTDRGAVWILFLDSKINASVRPSIEKPATSSTIVACIDVNIDAVFGSLGSYGATLTWDPAVLDYQSYSGGDSPFDIPVVNESNTATGSLAFSDADATGASGQVHVLCVEFDVIGVTGTTSSLDLELTSAFAAGTFADLIPSVFDSDATLEVLLECTVGDVNDDAAIDSGDALVILTDEIGLTIPLAMQDRLLARCGDANGDGTTNSTDANIILSFEVGLPIDPGFPINGSNRNLDDCSLCAGGGGGESASSGTCVESGSSATYGASGFSVTYSEIDSSCSRGRLVRSSHPVVSGLVLAEIRAWPQGIRAGQEFEAAVVVDTSRADLALGSYTARLSWDPDDMQFLGLTGESGFPAPMLNLADVSMGRLRFTQADPSGTQGEVEVLRVNFRASRDLRQAGRSFGLIFDALAMPGPGFEDLLPLLSMQESVGLRRQPARERRRR